MGRDKAMLELEGKTLLARAVSMLQSVGGFGRNVKVTICGERNAFEGADRAIIDRYPECGPLGGIEAALSDLKHESGLEWAFFVPVDMPLLTADLIDRLLAMWFEEIDTAGTSVRVCMIEIEGRPQPLVSLVHVSVLPLVRAALDAERYKVVPVLQSAGASCTSFEQEILKHREDMAASGQLVVADDLLASQNTSAKRTRPSDEEEDEAQMEAQLRETLDQFANVNTEADLMRVATLLRQRGSNR